MDDDEQLDWLTDMDEEILEVLSTGLTLGPTAIAQNIDRSREGVSNRLNSLQAGGLVEKVDRGKYRLADYEGQHHEIYEASEHRQYDLVQLSQLQEIDIGFEDFWQELTKEVELILEEDIENQQSGDNLTEKAKRIKEQDIDNQEYDNILSELVRRIEEQDIDNLEQDNILRLAWDRTLNRLIEESG